MKVLSVLVDEDTLAFAAGALAEGQGMSGKIRELALMSLRRRDAVPPRCPGKPAGTRISIRFSHKDMSELEARRSELGISSLSLPELVARAACAAVDREKNSVPSKEKTPHPMIQALGQGRSYRPEQAALIADLERAQSSGLIAVGEAATGSGKGLALAVAALRAVQRGLVPVIAAPTHVINQQVKADLLDLIPANGMDVRVRQYRGRREFVSETRLMEYRDRVEEADRRAQIDAWVERQNTVALDMSWLVDDLAEHVASVSLDEVVLARDLCVEPGCDLGMDRYQDQFASDERPGVMLVTHAMLAMDLQARYRKAVAAARNADAVLPGAADMEARTQALMSFDDPEAGVIPNWDVLLVDEAHALEDSVSSALTDTVSVQRLIRQLDQLMEHGAGQGSVVAAKAVLDQLMGLADTLSARDRGAALRHRGQPTEAHGCVATLVAVIDQALQKAKKGRGNAVIVEQRQVLQGARSTLARALKAREGAQIQFSPERQYPSVRVGPVSVAYLLKFGWMRAQSAAAVSATILVPDGQGVPALSYAESRLALPRSNRRHFLSGPHIPAWVTQPVTLHVFSPRRGHPLTPPKRGQGEADAEVYAQNIAVMSYRALRVVTGGTVILCTSYAIAAAITAQLTPHLAKTGRVLISADGLIPHQVQVSQFRQAYADGKAPVWVTLGRSWTGMDLTSEGPAEDDRLLECLIIPKLPFGLAMSTTHESRVARASRSAVGGILLETEEALIRLRQGVGRLVRRDGVPPRSLWILDPRVQDPSKAYARAFAGVLNRYPRIERH